MRPGIAYIAALLGILGLAEARTAEQWELGGWLALAEAGRPAEAEARFGRALELEPGRPMSLWGQFLISEQRGQAEAAADLADRLLRGKSRFGLPDLLRQRLEQLRQAAPTAGLVRRLGRLAEKAGGRPAAEAPSPEAALWQAWRQAAWAELARRWPRFTPALEELASSQPSLNSRWLAYQAALRLEPRHLRARTEAARMLLEAGWPELAEQWLEPARLSNPGSPLLLQAQAELYEAQARPAAAAYLLKKINSLGVASLRQASQRANGPLAGAGGARLHGGPSAATRQGFAPHPTRPLTGLDPAGFSALAKEAKALAREFPVVMLENRKRVELDEAGAATQTRRILLWLTDGGEARALWTFDYPSDKQLFQALRAERYAADGRRVESVPPVETDSPLQGSLESRVFHQNHRIAFQFSTPAPGDFILLEFTLVDRPGQRFLGDLFSFTTGLPVLLGVYEWTAPELRVEASGSAPARLAAPGRLEAHSLSMRQSSWIQAASLPDFPRLLQWYSGLARLDAPPDPELAEVAAPLCSGDPVPNVDAFVRGQIRYLSVPLGPYDYQPRTPAEVFRSRYGDCKDQARLCVELLRHCGVPAELVLARTRSMGELDIRVPYIGLFNHVIVGIPSSGLLLDTTAPWHRAGELPADLWDTPILRVHPDASLERTPPLLAEQHRLDISMRLRYIGDGTLQGRRWTTATGLFRPLLRQSLASLRGVTPQVEELPLQTKASTLLALAPPEGRLPVAFETLDPELLPFPFEYRSRVELDTSALDCPLELPPPARMEWAGGAYRFEARQETDGLAVLEEELTVERRRERLAPEEEADWRRMLELVRATEALQVLERCSSSRILAPSSSKADVDMRISASASMGRVLN